MNITYNTWLKEDNSNKHRGFERVTGYDDAIIPQRADSGSCGYDISVYSNEDVIIKPHESHLFETGLKAYMQEDEVLEIHVRSSIGIKRHCILTNVTGIIDSSYYNNPDNEGHILVSLTNIGSKPVTIKAKERVAQGIFVKYLTTDDDKPKSDSRTGGIGSTNK